MTITQLPSGSISRTKLDWKFIAGIDVDKVEHGLPDAKACSVLQDTLKTITFCDPESEFPEVENEFVRVFKIAQLTIRYLLHSQTKLTEAIENLQSQNDALNQDLDRIGKKFKDVQVENKNLKAECKRRKKTIEAQQDWLLKGKEVEKFEKCTKCDKTFINESFLASHMLRRHPGEVKDFEDKRSPSALTTLENSPVKQVQPSKTEVVVEDVREMLADVIKSELNKDNQNKVNIGSSGVEVEELKFVIKRQEMEMEAMRESLTKLKSDRDNEEGKLVSQERFWQARLLSTSTKYEAEMSDIHQQLDDLKRLAFEAKAKLDSYPGDLETQEVQQQNQVQAIVESDVFKPMIMPIRRQAKIEPDHEEEETHDQYDTIDIDAVQVLDEVKARKQKQRPRSLHEYATIEDLLDDLDQRWKSVEDLADKDPNFLIPYRDQASLRLDSVLEANFNFDLDKLHGLDDDDLADALAKIKSDRKKIEAKDKQLAALRKMCAEEVDGLLNLEDGNKNNKANPFAKRMTSARKSLLKLWRSRQRMTLVSNFQRGSNSTGSSRSSDENRKFKEEKKSVKSSSAEHQHVEPNVYVEMPPPAPVEKKDSWATSISKMPIELKEENKPVPAPRTLKAAAGEVTSIASLSSLSSVEVKQETTATVRPNFDILSDESEADDELEAAEEALVQDLEDIMTSSEEGDKSEVEVPKAKQDETIKEKNPRQDLDSWDDEVHEEILDESELKPVKKTSQAWQFHKRIILS